MFRSSNQIIEGFYRHFMSIYAAWDERQSTALAQKMIEKDLVTLGLYMGTVDEFGQLAELALLAECIAYVRIVDSAIDQRRMIDYWMDVVIEELHLHRIPLVPHKQSSRDIVEQLNTWSLTKELFDRGRIERASAMHMRHGFLEIADMFIMRDGHITTAEMDAMRELEQALMIESY
ncbi:MAG: hypothetical protein EAY65_06060 [Alphaproteobacteria bacterium]|nr:MAG: hypothetical protein EAY65_06060 [Alphaproteobacteria bacterium]